MTTTEQPELTLLLAQETGVQHADIPARKHGQGFRSCIDIKLLHDRQGVTIVGTRAIRFPACLCCREYLRMLLAS